MQGIFREVEIIIKYLHKKDLHYWVKSLYLQKSFIYEVGYFKR